MLLLPVLLKIVLKDLIKKNIETLHTKFKNIKVYRFI